MAKWVRPSIECLGILAAVVLRVRSESAVDSGKIGGQSHCVRRRWHRNHFASLAGAVQLGFV